MSRRTIVWTLAENELTKDGIPDETICVVIVETKQKRRFAAKVNVSATFGNYPLTGVERKGTEQKVVYLESSAHTGGIQATDAKRNRERLIGGTIQLEK